MENKKVLLGISGGVDSCISAILLQQKGYEVIGTTLELDTNTSKDAKNMCDSLQIPHHIYNCKEEFNKRENAKALKNFEDSSTTHGGIKILLAIDKLNEGVHVDGIDGCLMFRNIGENSSTLFLQQSDGRDPPSDR